MRETEGRSSFRIGALLGGAVALLAAILATGLAGDEEASRFLASRFLFSHPGLLLEPSLRPLPLLLHALLAPWGVLAARLPAVLATSLAAGLVARTAARAGWRPAWLAAGLFLAQPFLLAHAGTVMTEPWAALVVALGLAGFVERRAGWLVLAASLAPLVRLELVLLWPLVAGALLADGHGRRLLLVPLPLVGLLLAGAVVREGFDPLGATWIPGTYPARDPWHYLATLGHGLGAGVLVAAVAGIGRAVFPGEEEPPGRRALLGALVVGSGILLIHTAFASWRPLSFGNLRYLAQAAPAFALLGAAGIDGLVRRREIPWLAVSLGGVLLAFTVWARPLHDDVLLLPGWSPVPGILALLGLVPALGSPAVRRWLPGSVLGVGILWLALHPAPLHLRPDPEETAAAALGLRLRATPDRVSAAHPVVLLTSGRDPRDRDRNPPLTREILTMPSHDLHVVWDSHYAAPRGIPLVVPVRAEDWTFEVGETAVDGSWAGGVFVGERIEPGTVDADWLAAAHRAEVGIVAAERLVGFFPGDPVAWRSLAARRLALGELEEVDRALTEAERLAPDHPENRLLRAGWHERSGREREALVEAEQGLLQDPGNPELQLVAGRAALRVGQPERARPHLLAAATALPGRYEAQRLAGEVLAAEGDSAAAVPYLERARRLAP